jgi:hypothetical protein
MPTTLEDQRPEILIKNPVQSTTHLKDTRPGYEIKDPVPWSSEIAKHPYMVPCDAPEPVYAAATTTASVPEIAGPAAKEPVEAAEPTKKATVKKKTVKIKVKKVLSPERREALRLNLLKAREAQLAKKAAKTEEPVEATA